MSKLSMSVFEDLLADEKIKAEYKKTFLLNVFKKIVTKMKNDKSIATSIKQLFKQSTNKQITTIAVVRNYLQYEMTMPEAELMYTWFDAYFKKSDRRVGFKQDFKQELYDKQKGLCAVCGEPLSKDFSKNHVDHIIPWTLVGDELPNNYQFLCSCCNEYKSSHIDYIFKSLINLV